MKTHRLVFREVDRDGFENIRDGIKTVETRAATSKYRDIKAGDTLKIVCGHDQIEKSIIKVAHFDSIERLLKSVPMGVICPDAQSIDDVYKMYASFPGYRDKISQHGLMALYL